MTLQILISILLTIKLLFIKSIFEFFFIIRELYENILIGAIPESIGNLKELEKL